MSLLTSLQILDHPVTCFNEGDIIIKEAKPGGKVFVLIQGTVEVSIGDNIIASASTPGEIFGEIATIKGCNYGATVTATKDSSFFIIDNFISYLKQHPDDSIKVLKNLCKRLTDMNQNMIGHLIYCPIAGISPIS